MKNKKLIIGITVVAVLIAIAIIIMIRKAKKTGNLSGGTVNNIDSGSQEEISSNTPAPVKQPDILDKITTTVTSWWDDLLGIAPKIVTYTPTVFPLKYGSKNDEVLQLQIWLNDHIIVPYRPIEEDGKWGNETEGAVKRTLNVTQVTEAWYKANILKQVI